MKAIAFWSFIFPLFNSISAGTAEDRRWASPLQPGMIVALKSSSGKYLAACDNCKIDPNKPDLTFAFAHVDDPTNEPAAKWLVENGGDGKIALRSAQTYRFLSTCRKCTRLTNSDIASVNAGSKYQSSTTAWTVKNMGGGKIALKGYFGSYLATCRSCIDSLYLNDLVFVNVQFPEKVPGAQWTVEIQNDISSHSGLRLLTPGTRVALMADNNRYLSRYETNRQMNVAAVFVEHPENEPSAIWEVVAAEEGKIGLKADSGLFLTRCHNCLYSPYSDESATVHISQLAGQPYATWKAVDAGDGLVAFEGDLGNYLSRCYRCSPGEIDELGFVHVEKQFLPSSPWAKWKVVEFPSPLPKPKPAPQPTVIIDPPFPVPIQNYGKTVALQADNNMFLTNCPECSHQPDVNMSSLSLSSPKSDLSTLWELVPTMQGTFGFRNLVSQRFLAAYSGSVAVHVTSLDGAPQAQWIPKEIRPGLFSIRCKDSGLYLFRCNTCGENKVGLIESDEANLASLSALWRVREMISFLGNDRELSSSGAFVKFVEFEFIRGPIIVGVVGFLVAIYVLYCRVKRGKKQFLKFGEVSEIRPLNTAL